MTRWCFYTKALKSLRKVIGCTFKMEKMDTLKIEINLSLSFPNALRASKKIKHFFYLVYKAYKKKFPKLTQNLMKKK
jgi:hypothetical protein